MTNQTQPQAGAEALQDRDYVLVLDRSGSMEEPVSAKSSKSRWQSSEETAVCVARTIAKVDPDGIDVYTFWNKFKRYANVTPDTVAQVFKEQQPNGGTSLVPVLTDALYGAEGHFTRKSANRMKKNGTMILVVTDGQPDDQQEVASLIIKAANQIERDEELAISFIQVGNDPAASKFLKSLDDDLQTKGAKYDIVDTKTTEEIGDMDLQEVLLAALND